MSEYNWQESLDFRFYDFYERNDVDLIYIDEENPSSIALNFEIRNKSGIELVLEPYNQGSKVESKNQDTKTQQKTTTTNAQENTLAENEVIVSKDNFHIEIRFRPGTLSAASLVQIDLSEASKEEWLMSRPLFHNNKEVSLYFLKCGRPLKLVDSDKTTLTLRGFAANSAGGSRGTNVIINYNQFHPQNDTIPIAGTKVLNLTILGHRGQRKAPLAICFANQNTILNNGEKADDIELQITNISSEPIALSPKSELMIEIDAQAEGKPEPWAVAKKDEAANFNITIKKREIKESTNKCWCWNVDSSIIDKNTEEPRFTFRNIYRQLGSEQDIKSTVVKSTKELELPKNLEEDVIQFRTDSTQTQVAYPGTVWKNSTGYSLCFQEDGNLVLYNSNNRPLWASDTYQFERRADTLKFHPIGNLVLYQKGEPIWSTQTQKSPKGSQVYLELQINGNFVIYEKKNEKENPSQFLFETKTNDGVVGNLAAAQGWKKSSIDTDDSSHKTETPVVLESDYSFPSNEDLIFVLSNVKSSLPSGQGQIRVYYKDIPGYADGYQILNLYKTHLIERNKKIGIGKIPDPNTELDVKGSISATQNLKIGGEISSKTVVAESLVGQGAAVKGMIVMWYGESNNVPKGWAICDGNNGTPDLRDRFVIGAGNNQKGFTGGSSSVILTIDNMPSHKHSGITNESGRHNHKYNTAVLSQQDHDKDDELWSWKYEDKYTEHGGEHQHSFETDERGNGQSFDILPPYIALFFIMKL
ncbi:hypothetical protein [Nostoc sp. UHCC 0251]|uniref:hypothetical protein n=1 Tax=Nostoc sp. UHCC 0251 TaxID=3110240 RepID=UPI002B20B311|nr:hypothetical protein [Nostoc sp. UHCC 0251]MEA5622219.1 hypothetical protein [Nostoc sp. UHCC 0251]